MTEAHKLFTWQRKAKLGYEVSSKGDSRFSAFNALMPDGRSIECHYQCDVKGHQPGGTDWVLGKGKPPLNPSTDLWKEYLTLWRQWANNNLPLMRELYYHARDRDSVLTDCFATTEVNQARALATVLNELVVKGP
ncbi:MAG: hypothetical protein PHQ58_04690 [Rhodoferax sp.]|uniref:hypothetical protein n=1 Tax=Rhodoferax sp. TaxID=50421 RepID=UPI00260261D6|nr:hypothetical protein [Rhodoferax sp.]MDD2879710.1 hypothetical protein [Rhodoferax sp.]